MNSRIKKFVATFDHLSIDAFLVTCDANIAYLTGYPARDSWLIVFPQKAVYVTDGRYAAEVRKSLKGVTLYECRDSRWKAVQQLLPAYRVKRLGFDASHLTVAEYHHMKTALSPVKMRSGNGLVEKLRMIKEPAEIREIQGAIQWNLKALAYLKQIIVPGRTEKEILFRLEDYLRQHGLAFSFAPIIASGPNSSFPHAQISDRKVRNNEPVLVDCGIDIGGYKSDLTRMFFLGKISPLVKEVTEIVALAQHQAIAHIRPGVPASEVDQQARKCLRKNRLDKYFVHSLGHGVGLEIHEAPRISQKSDNIIQEGMIFTVEPGVYFPNKFGIRIEDMVLVTSRGCEVLSR